MSGFKFHTSSRSDHESIKLLTFQDSYVLHQASSIQSALSTINKEDAIAFPLFRDGVQNNSIDWYSKYSGLQSLESFSAEEQQRIHAQYFNFRQEVFAKFSSSSSLGSLFREILPDGVSNLNEHGEAYFPEIWSNGSDFTLVWGIYRKHDEIIFPVINPIVSRSPVGRGSVGDGPVGDGPVVSDPDVDDNEKPIKGGFLMLLLCVLVLIVMYFVGCHHCDDIISPISGEKVVNPAPGILPDQPNRLLPIHPDSLYLDPIDNLTVLDRINIYPKNQDIDYSKFVHDVKRYCPDTTAEFTHWGSYLKRVQIDFDHVNFPNMKEELKLSLVDYDVLIWNEMFGETNLINDPIYLDPDQGWHFSAINFDEKHMDLSNPNVQIAIIDNGFDLMHKDFSSVTIERQFNWLEHGTDIYALDDAFDPFYGGVTDMDHGSHVSGICFATPNNGFGSCGISPNCTFIPLQVGSNELGERMYMTGVIDAILYCINYDIDVINMSLGFSIAELTNGLSSEELDNLHQDILSDDMTLFFNEIYQLCEDNGIVVVTSAGNDGLKTSNPEFTISPMSNSPYPIYVMSHDRNNQLSDFSSITRTNDYVTTILAPGDEIYSSIKGNRTISKKGTSMAAPIVTSAVALMLSQDENLTPKEIRDIINSENKVEVLDGVRAPFLNIESLLNKTQQPM